jgi:hypothetical protein
MHQLDNVGTEEYFEDWAVDQPAFKSPVLQAIYNNTFQTIHVWPNATWCYPEELYEMGCLGDDYRTIQVHVGMNNDDMQNLATMAANGAPDEVLIDYIIHWMGG